MNTKTRRVVAGYMSLSEAERQEFDTEVERFKRSDVVQKRNLRESYEKMDLGPVASGGTTCPCCHR